MLYLQNEGELIIVGNFKASMIWAMNDSPSSTATMPIRKGLDKWSTHGRQLIDFLRDTDMVVLNGQFAQDTKTTLL